MKETKRKKKQTMAFLRIKLLEAILDHTKPLDPACSVNVKEAVTATDGSVALEQRKKTFHPEWDRCFDSHLKPGRRIQIIVNDRTDAGLCPLAEVTVESEALANECIQEEASSAAKLGVSEMCACTTNAFALRISRVQSYFACSNMFFLYKYNI